MGFLSPLFLIGAAAAVIPIALHLLKRQPEDRIRFAAVRMLETAPVEHSSRRRLRELLLLALRVTALTLLAVAFARPFFTSGAADAGTGPTIVVLDTSMSLSSPGAFDVARRRAREVIDGASPGSDLAVITFADAAHVAARPSADRDAARAVADAASPGFGGTNYRAALTTAAGLLAGGPGRIVAITDLQASGWTGDAEGAALLHQSATLEVIDVGAMAPNLAVTALRPSGDEIIATIGYTAPETGDAPLRQTPRVALTVDGKQVGVVTSPVDRNSQAEVALRAARSESAAEAVSVSVDDPNGIPGDNVRYLLLSGPPQPPVLLVTRNGNLDRDAFYLRRAITAAGDREETLTAEAVAAAELERWDAARLERHAAVVLLSTRGLDRRGRELLTSYVAGGGGLLIVAGPDVDADVATTLLEKLVVFETPDAAARAGARAPSAGTRGFAPVNPRHPIFRAFGGSATALGAVRVDRLMPLSTMGCATLATFTTGEPALVECGPETSNALGRGRVVVFASDLGREWNDLPLHAAFVPFVKEVLAHVAHTSVPRREYLVGEAPPGVPPTPGIATLADGAVEARAVAVNVDPAESNVERLSADDFQRAIARQKDGPAAAPAVRSGRQAEQGERLWQWALAAVLALLILEGMVGARTA